MTDSDEIKIGIEKVDNKTAELIMEFQSHYNEYCELHPEDKDRKDEIFQAWVMQKLAGIQISILELTESINSLFKTSRHN